VWLSIFYGFPIFSWIPTHNLNHHRYQNGPGDATSTSKLGGHDNLLRLICYPTLSSRWQAPELKHYLLSLRSRRSPLYAWALAQCVAVPLAHLGFLTGYVGAHGLPKGVLVYAVVLLIPALFAPWSMMVINYLQHIDCDPSSPDNHSRNFVGLVQNWLVFEAGLHTVHHEHPGIHFSEYRALHDQRKGKIALHLKQRDIISFVIKRYLLKQETLERAQLS
jgi:fatty acid desaturase